MSAKVSLVDFLRYLVRQKVFVVISDLEYAFAQKHRRGEVSISPNTRSGYADRLVANSTLLNFGILLRDESVLSVDDNPQRKWRNLHQIRNGQVAQQSMRLRLTRDQYLRIEAMGVDLAEQYDPDTVLYCLKYDSFRWMTDPSLVGRMYFVNNEYVRAKRAIVELEHRLEWLESEMRRLSKQIAWKYIDFHDRPPRTLARPKFVYDYAPNEPGDFIGWEWVLEPVGEPKTFQPMSDGPRSYPSFVMLAGDRYEILYHLRPKLTAIVREYELAAWEHWGRKAENRWDQMRVKRTVWQFRKLSDGSTLRRRDLVRRVRVRPGTLEANVNLKSSLN